MVNYQHYINWYVRQRQPAISDDYVVYFGESNANLADPLSYQKAIVGSHNDNWLDDMRDEM